MDYETAWIVGVGTFLVLGAVLWAYGRFLVARGHSRSRPRASKGSS